MAFSIVMFFSVLQVYAAACALKEKLRKHLRKSAFVSDEHYGNWREYKAASGRSDMLNRSRILMHCQEPHELFLLYTDEKNFHEYCFPLTRRVGAQVSWKWKKMGRGGVRGPVGLVGLFEFEFSNDFFESSSNLLLLVSHLIYIRYYVSCSHYRIINSAGKICCILSGFCNVLDCLTNLFH
ncbi:hypothetical protein SAMN02910371_01382 [Butyrivibrio sp. INlla14]|nr:hypothetical protein SAMN02910371_01382 [Butyrivibrio sp. INlla14]